VVIKNSSRDYELLILADTVDPNTATKRALTNIQIIQDIWKKLDFQDWRLYGRNPGWMRRDVPRLAQLYYLSRKLIVCIRVEYSPVSSVESRNFCRLESLSLCFHSRSIMLLHSDWPDLLLNKVESGKHQYINALSHQSSFLNGINYYENLNNVKIM